MSSSAGIGVICWWYWSKRTFILVEKKRFLCPPAASIPSLVGCPLLVRSTLVKKNLLFISQKNTFSCVHRGLQPQEMYQFLSMQGPRAIVLGAGRHRSARPVPVPGWCCLYGAFRAAWPIWWHTVI